jgi:hypothetical protein
MTPDVTRSAMFAAISPPAPVFGTPGVTLVVPVVPVPVSVVPVPVVAVVPVVPVTVVLVLPVVPVPVVSVVLGTVGTTDCANANGAIPKRSALTPNPAMIFFILSE